MLYTSRACVCVYVCRFCYHKHKEITEHVNASFKDATSDKQDDEQSSKLAQIQNKTRDGDLKQQLPVDLDPPSKTFLYNNQYIS